MNKLDLKNLGVEEMNATELRTVEGGGLIGDVGLIGTISNILNGAVGFVDNTLGSIGVLLGKVLGSL